MSVGLVIVSHSAQLAKGVAELAGQMVQGKVTLADAGGTEGDLLGTSVDKIYSALQSVMNPDGVLVLLDLGSAVLSTETALEMLDPAEQSRVQISSAPLVEGTFAAALEASLGSNLTCVREAAEQTTSKKELQKLKPIEQEQQRDRQVELTESLQAQQQPVPRTTTDQPSEIQFVITNPTGLHARPAVQLVQTAARFHADIQILAHNKQANAARISEVLKLAVHQNETITVRASGQDADAALQALSELVQENFHEREAATSPDQPAISSQQATPAEAHVLNKQWQGIATSKGIALGPAFLYQTKIAQLSSLPTQHVAPEQVPDEQAKLHAAIITAAQHLLDLAQEVRHTIGESEAGIFEAQTLLLQDPAFLQAAFATLNKQQVDAVSALALTGEQQAQKLAKSTNTLIAQRSNDIRDAVVRAIMILSRQDIAEQSLQAMQQPGIVVARDLPPSDTALLRPEMVLGICTIQGGPTAHAAILARALGIPAIAGLPEAVLDCIHNGEELALNAEQGLLYQQPNDEVRQQLSQDLAGQQQQEVAKRRMQQPIVIHGKRIYLQANIGRATEAQTAREWRAEGIGLLRTEFLFAAAPTLPGIEEQRQRYAQIFRAFQGSRRHKAGPIVARTLDAGADKPMPALAKAIGLQPEANPALGLRGLRIHLAHPELLKQQFQALLLAAADTRVELRIMVPMLTTVEEWQQVKHLFAQTHTQLRAQHKDIPQQVPLGIMIEVPAAALMARELATNCDFFSIGVNDLLQYILACDRTMAYVTSLYTSMQPALFRLLKYVADAGQEAHIPVAVCGEIARETLLAPVLVGLGITELSMAPTAIHAVRTALTRKQDQNFATLAEQVLHAKTAAEVSNICARFAE
ncbi:MAG TPA: phosphoenolpyruvate--protein phosphotransferase [Ktedonobacteraceae bacterium]|nr:phosphoenolpyruvate--protein phosphotransferase [Ktedonobacteraceae bacterium]